MKQTCRACKRTVVMVEIAGDLIATESEVIQVVPARRTQGPESGGVRMAQSTTPARRLHAELCDRYVEDARRAKSLAELRAFNKRNRNHGL